MSPTRHNGRRRGRLSRSVISRRVALRRILPRDFLLSSPHHFDVDFTPFVRTDNVHYFQLPNVSLRCLSSRIMTEAGPSTTRRQLKSCVSFLSTGEPGRRSSSSWRARKFSVNIFFFRGRAEVYEFLRFERTKLGISRRKS